MSTFSVLHEQIHNTINILTTKTRGHFKIDIKINLNY